MIPIRQSLAPLLFAMLVASGGSALAQGAKPKDSLPTGHPVLTGVDVLRRDGFKQLAGRRVGLITNHTGRTADGVTTVQLLHDAPNVDLRVLFSPEHGYEGKLDVSRIGDTRDAATGLKVYSLYGETRRPTAAMLADVDTLVFDIQDIGARFYTYVSTMGEGMKAAAEHHKRFVVLDRPNPINGVDVAGPMLDPGREGFTAYHSLPVRHGMTTGELARMFRAERKLDLDLVVIPCEGWRRQDFWDATGLVWINPSPNMRSLTQALLYPGVGLLEYTNLSVGRGTDTPFEVIGAPWIKHRELAAALNSRNLPGVRFIPVEIAPTSSKFVNEKCYGINFLITNRSEFDPVTTGLEVAVQLRTLHRSEWQIENYPKLLGSDRGLQAVLSGKVPSELVHGPDESLRQFLERRKSFLLYR